jgi:signal peptidase II
LRVLYVSLAVVVIDQVSKFLIKGLNIGWMGIHLIGVPYGTSKPIFGDGVRLLFIENPGMAFGMNIIPKLLLIAITIIASLVILFYLYKRRNGSFLLRLAMAFILGGALGNLIDRTFYGLIFGYAPVFFGRVVDFIQIAFWNFTFLGKTYTSWPILNFADLSVTIGFLIMVVFNKRIFISIKDVKSDIPMAEGIPADAIPENRTE